MGKKSSKTDTSTGSTKLTIKKLSAGKFAPLRAQAEKRLNQKIVRLREESKGDMQRVLHELRVHQIELEMQNEELRRAQQELEQSRAKYTDLYDFAPTGYFTFDKNGLVIEANLTGCSMLGIERAYLIKKPFHRFVSKESKDVFYNHHRHALTPGLQQTCEITIVRKNGDKFEARLESIAWPNEKGEPTFCRTALTDITERKHAEQKIRDIAKFPEENPYPVLRISQDSTIVYSNGPGKQLLESWKQHEGQKTPIKWRNMVREVLKSGRPMVEEVHLDSRIVSLVLAPVTDSGYVNIYGRDITRLRKKEEDLQILNRTLKALGKSNRALTRAAEQQQYLREVCDIIVKDCGHIMVWIGFAENDEGKTVRPIVYSGFEKRYLDTLNITWADTGRGRGPTGTAIRTGRPCLCKNMLTDPAFAPWRKEATKRGYASSVAVPVMNGTRAIGVINISSKHTDAFTESEIDLLTELAGDVSYGISTIQLRNTKEYIQRLLRNERDFVSAILDTAGALVVVIDKQGRITRFNRACEELTGYSVSEVLGRIFWEMLILPEELPSVKKTWKNLWAGDFPNRHENHWLTKDGSRRLIAWSNTAITNPKGQVEYIIGTGTDITQSRQAEEALRESEQRLRALAEAMPQIVWTADAEGGIEWFNHRWYEYTGLAQGIGEGWSWDKVTHPDDMAHTLKKWQDALQQGKLFQNETRVRRRDGQYHWFLVRAWPMRNADGKAIRWFGTNTDIDELKQAEEALRQEKESYQTLAENLPGLVYRVHLGENQRMEFFNQSLFKLTGYTQEELTVGEVCSIEPLTVAEDREAVIEEVQLAIRKHQPFKVEYRLRTKAGDLRYFSERGQPVYAPDGICTHLDGVIFDITDRKQAEEQLKKLAEELKRSNKDLDEFAVIVSHDLREPLRAVAGFIELLEHSYAGKLDDKAKEYIKYATNGANRMSDLISGLLECSRVQTRGKIPKLVPSQGALRIAMENLQNKIETSQAEITSDELPEVEADGMQLTQLFQNLIDNAIKFSNEQRPKIHVGCVKQENRWQFSVRDNGIGIDPQAQQRIFKIFQRLNTHDKYPGYGVGLTICKKIVERHGGRIWVESQEGKGSTFYFTI